MCISPNFLARPSPFFPLPAIFSRGKARKWPSSHKSNDCQGQRSNDRKAKAKSRPWRVKDHGNGAERGRWNRGTTSKNTNFSKQNTKFKRCQGKEPIATFDFSFIRRPSIFCTMALKISNLGRWNEKYETWPPCILTAPQNSTGFPKKRVNCHFFPGFLHIHWKRDC